MSDPIKTEGEAEVPAERVNCGTPPDRIWVHPWREMLYYSPTDQPDYIEYVRVIPPSISEQSQRAAERIEPSPQLTQRRAEIAAIIQDELKGEDDRPHCWHCGVILACKPILRCEDCPDECDIEGCDAFAHQVPEKQDE